MTEANGDPKDRVAARVILLSPTDQVLLIRFVVQRTSGEFIFWATPGGSVERGETPLAAASRELLEELGLRTPLEGPVHSTTERFEHEGSVIQTNDVFFIGRCASDGIRLLGTTAAERSAMHSMRWWTVEEVAQAKETVFPRDLAQVLRRVATS